MLKEKQQDPAPWRWLPGSRGTRVADNALNLDECADAERGKSLGDFRMGMGGKGEWGCS